MLKTTSLKKNSHEARYVEANLRWNAVLEFDSENETALANLVSNSLFCRDVHAAERILDQLVSVEELDVPGRAAGLKARLAIQKHDPVSAIAAWEEAAVAWQEKSADYVSADNARVNAALQHLSLDNVARAQQILDSLSMEARASEAGRLLMARCYVHERRWSEAIEQLENLNHFTSRRESAVNLLYRCYLNDFRHECAGRLCEKLNSTEHPDLDYLVGKVRFGQKRYQDAIEYFSKAIDSTGHADSKIWLIRTLAAINDKDAALAKAELLAAMENTDAITRARCWDVAGRPRRAAKLYLEAARASQQVVPWMALVNFHHGYRQLGKAYAFILEAERRGIATEPFATLKARISQAFSVAGVRLPGTRFGWKRFEFLSSERMVTAVVDRILEAPPAVAQKAKCKADDTKRIALIISSLGPGGAERQIVNLANGLVELSGKDETYLLCTHLSRVDQDRFYLDQLDERVDVREYYKRDIVLDPAQIPALRPYADLLTHIQPFSRQLLLLHLANALLEIKPDVVHGWLDETFINTALVCHMLGIPCVVGRWGSMPPGVNRTISERDQSNINYLNHAYREISRLPGLRLTSNSRLTGDAYARLMQVPQEHVHIVYNGIDEAALMAQAVEANTIRESLSIPVDAKVVGTVFRMTEEKRPLLWVDVAARLAEQHPDMHFVIVGAGPMECQIRDLAVALSLKNLHLPGKQTRIGGWFSLFDVMLLTSRVEGVSNAVVESQFCQCPVVAPNVGGLSEAMSHQVSGLLLDDHSAENFASAVASITDDPAYHRQLSDGASEFARSKFSVPTMVASYRTIFGLAD